MIIQDVMFDWKASYDRARRRGRIYESLDIQKVYVSFMKYMVIEATPETVIYVELKLKSTITLAAIKQN